MTDKSPATDTRMPAALRAFLMLGHPDRRGDHAHSGPVLESAMPFLRGLVDDPAIAAPAAWRGITALAALVSNQDGRMGYALTPLRKATVEELALALLAHGADGTLGIESWAEGHGKPALREPFPEQVSEAWLLAHVNPCPLAGAFANGFVGVVEKILDGMPAATRGGVLDRLQCAGGEPIVHAAARGNAAMLEVLLRAGANPMLLNALGQTPLHQASIPESVRALLRAGADATVRDANGMTCAQAWTRRQANGGILDDMLAAIGNPRQSMRDKVFLGTMTAKPKNIERTLKTEGFDGSAVGLAWTGILGRLSGVMGQARCSAPTQKTSDWLGAFLPGHEDETAWLRQCVLMAAATLNVRNPAGLQTNSDGDRLITLLDAAGFRGIPAGRGRGGENNIAKRLLHDALDALPGDIPAALDQVAGALSSEGIAMRREHVTQRLFDMTIMALVSANGLGGRVVGLAQERLQRWPEDAGRMLRKWARDARAEDVTRKPDPMTPDQARWVAEATSGWFNQKNAQGEASRAFVGGMCREILPLWKDVVMGLREQGEAAWNEVGAEVLAVFDKTVGMHETHLRGTTEYRDWLALRQQQNLTAGAHKGPRRRV